MAWRGGGGHAHVPPSNARRPPTTRWRRASEGRSPGQVAPRLAQQAGAHAHAGRGPGRDPGTPPPGGRARAVAGQPTTDKPGPAPRPGARAPERGVGGARRRKGTDDSPPSAHNTAAGPDGGGGHGEEAAAGLGSAHTPERATGFGSRTEEATTRTPGGKGNEAPAKSDGEQDRGPTAREPHGFPTRRLEGAEPSRHRGAHGVPPPEASSTRAVPWHPRTPTRPAPSANPGANPRRGPSGPATRSSRATGPWNALPHARRPTTRAPPQPDPRRAQPAPLSLFFPPFLRSRERGRQHSARDPAPQDPWRPKGGAGTRQAARPGLGPDTVTGEGEEKGRTRARSSEPRRRGKKKAAQNGRWAGGCGEGAHARSEDQRARARRRARARGRARQRRREPGHRVNVHGIPPPPARGRSRDARGASRPQHP